MIPRIRKSCSSSPSHGVRPEPRPRAASKPPIARAAPGADGVVDLYLMPAYDDIASLYYYGNRWHIHYMAEDAAVVAKRRDGQSRPLSKASLRKVLEELKSHAG